LSIISPAGWGNNMNQGKQTISAVILAKNEDKRIADCLASLTWTDERIVVDNASTDKTATIAQQSGGRVVYAKEKDFSKLRTLGKEEVKGEWILYVDADEIVSPGLITEIRDTIKTWNEDSPVAYTVKRSNIYLGSPWPYSERMLRLFRKSALIGWYGELHESPRVKGPTGQLYGALVHHTHRSLEEMVVKTNQWSAVEAKLRRDANHPPVVWWRLWRVMVTGFWQSYVSQGGWKAGTVGLIESLYQGFSLFITYAKLWELQQNEKKL